MISWADAHKKIAKSSREFNLLQIKFDTFFTHVESQLKEEPSLNIKGIQVHKGGSDFFTANFAGRDLRFVFTTMLNGSETLAGRVTVYMSSKFSEEKFTKIDSFEFSTSGKTTLNIEDHDDDPAELDHDAHALCIFLGFLYKSLSY